MRDDGVIHPPFVEGETIIDLLRRIGVRVDGAVVIRGGTPIPVDETVRSNDDITVIDVQSGG